MFYKYIWREEEFEDAKGEIRIHTSNSNREHSGQKKKIQMEETTTYKTYIQLKIE